MNEAAHKALTLVVATLYPYQPRYLSVPFAWAKRKLMRATGLNRWDFDKWLLDLQPRTSFVQCPYDLYRAFCLLKCNPGSMSRLNYVSTAQRGEETSENSYCSLQFDMRNKYIKEILAELEMGKDA